MSRPFKFKAFTIQQAVNSQKIGSDSMLLGAWATGTHNRILDIGTGTGILALMLAQKNPIATITAIEPDLASLNEARENFQASPYKNNMHAVHASLQNFGAMEKFDFIISNPPYFENAFLSQDLDRNRARHTNDLPIHELYEAVSELLDKKGNFSLIIPFDAEEEHLKRAENEGLFPNRILRTIKPNGAYKRSLIQFGSNYVKPQQDEIKVKNAENKYSAAYIELTKDFYLKDLSKL